MSWQHQAYAWSVESLSSSRKFVLLAIANRVGDTGCCWPSVERLCKDTGLSERCVRESLRDLEADKYLKSYRREGKTSAYQMLLPKQLDLPQADIRNLPGLRDLPGSDVPPRQQVPPTPATGAGQGGQEVPPNLKEESIKNQREERADARRALSVPFFQEGRFQEEWTEPPESWQGYAKQQGLRPRDVWEDFRDHVLSYGQNVANWDARWRKWCREAAKRQTEATQQAGGDINPAYFDEWTPEKARQQEREYFEAERRRNANGG